MIRKSTRLIQAAARKDLSAKLSSLGCSSSWKLHHDNKAKQFYLELNADKAFVDYECIDTRTIDLQHTEVPKQFAGKGVAKVLAKEVFEFCIRNDMKIKLTCEYLQKFYKDNEEAYKKHVVEC